MLDFSVMRDLAVKCKEFRKKNHLKQVDLAKMLHCQQSDILRVESGLVPVSCDWFFRLLNLVM